MALRVSFPCKFLCLVALGLVVSLGLIRGVSSRHSSTWSSSTSKLPTIKYYVHALDNSSAYIINAVNPNSAAFGQTVTFSYPLTRQQDAGSSSVGFIRGLEIFDNLDSSFITILVLNTVTYNDGTYNGTISLHGQANINEKSYEITVVGGTGDFRGVRGYSAVTNLGTPAPDHIFEHVLHFRP